MLSLANTIKPTMLSVLILTQLSINTQAESFDYQAQINKYLDCQALQHVLANILSENEQSFQNNEYYQSGLDSRVIADELARVAKIRPQDIQEIYSTYLHEYRNVLADSQSNADYEQFLASLLSHVKRCLALNELQSDIIHNARSSKLNIE